MAAADDRLMLSIPSNPHYLGAVRAFLTSLLHKLDFGEQEVHGIVLAVNEAYANIIEHCYQGDTAQRIDLTVQVAPTCLTVEIRDYGEPPDMKAIQPRSLQDIRPKGLGTHFMRMLMDDITYQVSNPGTLLRMTKRRSVSCKSP